MVKLFAKNHFFPLAILLSSPVASFKSSQWVTITSGTKSKWNTRIIMSETKAHGNGHGHGHGGKMPEIDSNSFIQTEMRKVAMKLHTRDQAKEGEKEEKQTPFQQWIPTRKGYLQFLVDSKYIYDIFEKYIAEESSISFLKNSGLERGAALEKDIDWLVETYGESEGITKPEVGSFGMTYGKYLEEIINGGEKKIPAFICHFYNHYFAHTAGGIMIGKKVSGAVLDNKELEFYKWEGDVRAKLKSVSDSIDEVASNWSREEKDMCLDETVKTFQYGGSLLGYITQSE